MKILGIISEYNPFHNGHLYHLKKSMELTGADASVAVMSGDFVQRGAPAFVDKYTRAQAALESGVSVVIELPVPCASASAELFSEGAVSLLQALGCIDSLCFGSECGDLDLLKKAADVLSYETPKFQSVLRDELKMGHSFPAARKKALQTCMPASAAGMVLDSPNNILGVEYLKAMKKLNTSFTPYTIRREASDYHDTRLSGKFASASAIRKSFQDNSGFPVEALNALPGAGTDLLITNFSRTFPVWEDDFSLLLKYRLLQERADSLCRYADVNQDLANRIVDMRNQFRSWSQFVSVLKTRELTYTRISRALLHILLGITKQDLLFMASRQHAPYARVLGFRRDKKDVLSEISRCSRIPLLLRSSDTRSLPADIFACLEKDLFASNLYSSVQTDKFGEPVPEEFGRKLLVI